MTLSAFPNGSRLDMTGLRPAFLLSLPRSGSTLLQRLIAAHSQVATTAEPWLLLPPLYALRPDGVYAEYSHVVTVRAISGLIERLPAGRADYLAAVNKMATHVYERLSPPGTRIFLDKTPRYGLVVDDLLATFPEGKFVILHRNPLAVVASIVSSFAGGRWKPYHHKQDLFLLSSRLLDAQQRNPEAFAVLRYEDVVQDPEPTLRGLMTALELEWEPEILTSFVEVSVAGNVGDRTGTRDYDSVSTEPLEKWRQHLASPVRKAWTRRYLRWLGEERLEIMGYDLSELMDELDAIPNQYLWTIPDAVDALRGTAWSVSEIEIVRSKMRSLPHWREIFTHT